MNIIPRFYNPGRVGTLFHPDVAAIAGNAGEASLGPGADDTPRTLLLLIDMQIDFRHEGGTLYVPGATDDIRRVIRFIYLHAGRISHIACSLDSHYPLQIFHASWWTGQDGKHPEPYTVITVSDVEDGIWKPLLEAEWSREYVRKLRQLGKKDLVVWPYHVPIGGIGSALDPELWSAVFWHSIARRCQPTLRVKGSIPKTEHYSILSPEVPVPEYSQESTGQDLVDLFDQHDHIILAGEAETHCVMETLADLVDLFKDQPGRLGKISVLRDCMSPVIIPGQDLHAKAVERFREYESRGVRFMNSTDKFPF